MYDIHHHLLFGLDDGPATLETSLAMAKMAAAEGITHIVCTPHASDRYPFKVEENAGRLATLRQALAAFKDDLAGKLELGMGCDFHLNYENIEDALANKSKYTINGGQYLLIEFPDFGIPLRISDAMYELQIAGMSLIVTHPERNQTLRQQPERLAEWIREGHLLQVTAGTLTGRFGRTAEKSAREMLEKQWVSIIATDAHNTESRPPKMREAYEVIARDYGSEYAHLICYENPKAVFENRPLPAQPEPLGVYETDLPPKKSFLSRIFSR